MKLTVLLDNLCGVMPVEVLAQTLRAALGKKLRCTGKQPLLVSTVPQDAAYGWLAENCGLQDAAALAALLASRGRAQPGLNYYELTPCHWELARDHAVLAPLEALTPQEAGELISTANAAIAAELGSSTCLMLDVHGWRLQALFDLPGPSFVSALTTPTLLAHTDEPAARQARRLLNLIQMAWHEHAVNEARQLKGQLAINALWLHGGAAPAIPLPPTINFDCIIDTQHRAPLLAAVLQQPLCSFLNPQAEHALLWVDAARDRLGFSGSIVQQPLQAQLKQLADTIEAVPIGTTVTFLNCQANTLQLIRAHVIEPGWRSRLRDTFLPSKDLVECIVQTDR